MTIVFTYIVNPNEFYISHECVVTHIVNPHEFYIAAKRMPD